MTTGDRDMPGPHSDQRNSKEGEKIRERFGCSHLFFPCLGLAGNGLAWQRDLFKGRREESWWLSWVVGVDKGAVGICLCDEGGDWGDKERGERERG